MASGSVETNNKRRDAQLRSAAFLDAERSPRLAFESSEIRSLDAGTFEISGHLTMHGVTRPITLTAAMQLSRRDYGITYMPVLVSDTVNLRLEISAVRIA